jgi:hypothetical protein
MVPQGCLRWPVRTDDAIASMREEPAKIMPVERLVAGIASMPVCAASLRIVVRNAGQGKIFTHVVVELLARKTRSFSLKGA